MNQPDRADGGRMDSASARPRRWSLRTRLVVPMIALVVVAALGFGVLNDLATRQEARTLIDQRGTTTLALIAQRVDDRLRAKEIIAQLLADNLDLADQLETRDIAAMSEQIRPVHARLGFGYVDVYAPDGQELLSVGLDSEINHLGLMRQALAGVTDSAVEINEVGLIVEAASPVRGRHGIVGALLVGSTLAGETLKEVTTRNAVELAVVRDGQLVTTTIDDSDLVRVLMGARLTMESLASLNHMLAPFQYYATGRAIGDDDLLVALVPTADVGQAARQRNLLLLGGTLAMVSALVVLGVVLARDIARPLEATVAATRDMARGNYRQRVQPSAIRELDELGQAINHLTQQLEVQIDQVQQLNADLERRVAERTAQLEVANRELESFSYSISHDLRAPLRSIDGFSQALLEDNLAQLEPRGQEYLRRVRAASQRMGELIDAPLRLSRLTRGEMSHEPVDLSALAADVARDLQQIEPARAADWQIAPNLIVDGDPRLLRAAIENLLSNAWKFTGQRERARIECGALRRDGETIYFVRDNGAGFDMTYADKLFGAFQRLHGRTEFEGHGIGLATVQRIIHRHGGRVWGEGQVDQGATFYFTLGGAGRLAGPTDRAA